jgi:ABC-type branched-subunit amino acid transport system ATPase component
VAVLQVEGLVAGYGDAPIVNGVSLYVDPGEIVAIVGPNGAGKSTLLKALVGLVKIQGGRVTFLGHDIAGRSPESIVQLGVGYVPQVANIFSALSVRENLEIMLPRRMLREEQQRRLQEMLVLFPSLRPRLAMSAGVLSGGERQMLALARGLITRPQLLMLDEITAAVAPRVVALVFDKIVEINCAGIPVLLVEQNARRALACATRGYVLEGGRNAMTAPAAELLASPEMARLYLGGETIKRTANREDT